MWGNVRELRTGYRGVVESSGLGMAGVGECVGLGPGQHRERTGPPL